MATQLKPGIECSKEEWQARLDLAACYRIFDHLGWSESIYNHISLKVPGEEDTFLINPFGLLYSEVTASNLVKIDVEGGEAGVVAGARKVLTTARPVLLMELNERALHAQGQSAEGMLCCLRTEYDYDILSFSPVLGRPVQAVEGVALSANIVAVPRERNAQKAAW